MHCEFGKYFSFHRLCSSRSAVVQPLIKKQNLDPSVVSNFRPISKLLFLSKAFEKVVLKLQSHLDFNDISKFHKFQSSFKSHHRTETALLRVVNDLLLTDNSGNSAVPVLLDLTAALVYVIMYMYIQAS